MGATISAPSREMLDRSGHARQMRDYEVGLTCVARRLPCRTISRESGTAHGTLESVLWKPRMADPFERTTV